ncbi:hypothetical protein IQ260_19135 [Leptolyngbya cf. ectocarpi LEGE 11479]|uniref:Uncharacterized protein n=1 Tax=Leptolyngbya cf. ectocarpi LEGE 11479 TaxID=1828722 RepID=A0A928ZWL4_LEPEC|nr:hypothetical protein [Leptolyngbya ectocarpi]MBE9068763.1 hypothetical protein [Leptolyngbya cf. ectocarpi LEGE 11479]
MGSSPFRSIFLPSLVSSGVAFAVITLPLSMANSVPTWVSPSQSRGDLISPLDNSAKPIIRYIGIAIIGSVGTGMVTADILRRIYRRQRALAAAPEPFETSVVSEVASQQQDASKNFEKQIPASRGVGSSMSLNGQGLLAKKLASGHTVVHFKGYTQGAHVDGLELTPIALDELVQLDADLPPVDIPILTFLDQVDPTHLDTGDAMVFGVRYQNKYYCLWRSTTDQERAVGWARRLLRQHRDIILTQNNQAQYSLWYVPHKHLR